MPVFRSMWCGWRSSPVSLSSMKLLAFSAWCERRMPAREGETLRLGTAMGSASSVLLIVWRSGRAVPRERGSMPERPRGFKEAQLRAVLAEGKLMANWYARPVLAVRDAPASLDFYSTKLGFSEEWRYEDAGRLRIAQVSRA